ncbi:MAG: hypothetical protein J4400_00305 [Candidatus Aenigmarchaeota archaeon]|nr:hypothetical protein [Candidatus Aenigmarchaeota archaeon]
MKYEGILIALYILALIVIVVELFSMVALTVVIVLLIVMIAVQKAGLENSIKSFRDEKNEKFSEILAKIEEVSKKSDSFKEDLSRQVVFVDNRVADVRHFVESEISNTFSDISRRLGELEERLKESKQSLASAVGSLDERIQDMQREEEESLE